MPCNDRIADDVKIAFIVQGRGRPVDTIGQAVVRFPFSKSTHANNVYFSKGVRFSIL